MQLHLFPKTEIWQLDEVDYSAGVCFNDFVADWKRLQVLIYE